MIAQRERLSSLSSCPQGAKTPEKTNPVSTFEVVVMFADVPGTLKALKTAAELAHNLHGRIRILAPEVVPYPLPLENAQVCSEFTECRFQTIARDGRVEPAWTFASAATGRKRSLRRWN